MQLLFFLTVQAALSVALSIPGGLNKRKAETNATLLAYGLNSSAWPIAYGLSDGNLYITQNPDDYSANLAPVTWDLPSITGENWIVNATFANGTSAGSLYLRPESSNAVGLLPMTYITRINGTVSGFALFATQLVYNNNTYLEAQFWAEPTKTSGVYSLVWNSDGMAAVAESYPVVIKGVES
ncbi:Glycoside hydrolase family 12 [Macrophomina phaseolina MS6]|uniref:Glycoside hydrolase family 12 n=1 Tax=Macrophomina phaseolina (strain MS6) TaxID=1126212 RepID=K2S0I1_MACPH|nr:Glycoside hydrolase family 12 [Macrophomina phaseolina MS6]